MRRIHPGLALFLLLAACTPRGALVHASRAWQPPGIEVPVFEQARTAALVPDPFALSTLPPLTAPGAALHETPAPRPPPRPKHHLSDSSPGRPYQSLGEIVVPMTPGAEQVALRRLMRHADALDADAVRNVRVITYGTGKRLVGEVVRYPPGEASSPSGEASSPPGETPALRGPAATPAPPEPEDP